MAALVFDLCKFRGYNPPESTENHFDAETFCTHTASGLLVHIISLEFLNLDATNHMLLALMLSERGQFKTIILFNKARKIKALQKLADVELFDKAELKILLGGSSLLPRRFELLDARTHAEIKRRYDCLPKMLSTDPIARLHAFKPRDIILIERKSGEICYREIVT